MSDFNSRTGPLALSARLRRVSDLLCEQVEQLYRAQKIELAPRFFPLLHALRDGQALGIVELSIQLGVSHAAVSQMATALMKERFLLPRPSPDDDRKRIVTLSPKGKTLLAKVRPAWNSLVSVLSDPELTDGISVLAGLDKLERCLHEKNLTVRTLPRIASPTHQPIADVPKLDILPWTPDLKGCFVALNQQWIEERFELEPGDRQLLSDPERYIILPGGMVFFARLQGAIVGTCALVPRVNRRFQLDKLAVSPLARRRGVGRAILRAALDWVTTHGGTLVEVETNSSLIEAVSLYKKFGFRHVPPNSTSSNSGFSETPMTRVDTWLAMQITPVKPHSDQLLSPF